MRMAISPCFMPLIDRLDKGAASPDLGVPSLQLGKFRCMRLQVHTEKSSSRGRWGVGLRVGQFGGFRERDNGQLLRQIQ